MSWGDSGYNCGCPADLSADRQGRLCRRPLSYPVLRPTGTPSLAPPSLVAPPPPRAEGVPENCDCPRGVILPSGHYSGGSGRGKEGPRGCTGTLLQESLSGHAICYGAGCSLADSCGWQCLGSSGLHPRSRHQTVSPTSSPGHSTCGDKPWYQSLPTFPPLPSLPLYLLCISLPLWVSLFIPLCPLSIL